MTGDDPILMGGWPGDIDYGRYNSQPIVGTVRPASAVTLPVFTSPRLSDEDVERIARRVAELLKGEEKAPA